MSNQIFASDDSQKMGDELARENLEAARIAHQRYLIKQQDEDWNTAIEAYINAVKYNPELSESYYRLAFLMWEKGKIDVDAAIEQCKKALYYSPESPNAYIYKGFFDKLAENYLDAEFEFKKAIELTGLKSARPRLLLSLVILKKINRQKTSFKDLLSFLYYFISGSVMLSYDIPSLKILTQSFNDDFSVFAYEKAGKFLEKIKLSKAAYNLYEIASSKTGHKEIFYSKMGDISLHLKKYEEAYEAYYNAYISNPQNKLVLMKLATLTQSYFPDMTDESIDYYTKLLELHPQDSGFIYYELGHLYLKKNDKVHSVNAFRLALEQDKTNPFYHNSLAYAYLKAELYDDAISHYNTAISINPDDEWTSIVCHALGSTYAEVYGDFVSAIEVFNDGMKLNPENYDIRLSLGDVLMAAGKIDDAIKVYCSAINIDEEDYRAYSKVGLAFWENDMLEEAVISYQKSIELNSDFDIAQNNLGVIYLDGIGSADDALPCFENAININPSYTLAYFNAARANEMLKNKTKAAEYYQKAIDMNRITQDLDENEIKERLHSLFEL